MLAECLNNEFEDSLTLGKRYEVEELSHNYVFIHDDNGAYSAFSRDLFRLIG
jgi:hypothetical protein